MDLMRRRWTISAADTTLFRERVGDVRRLQTDTVAPSRKRPPPRARFRRADDLQVLEDSLNGWFDAAELDTGDELFFSQPGVDQRVLKRLRRGQLTISGECDLHGLTVAAARAIVAEFLTECALNEIRCARIIHGKGLRSGARGPVIKRHLAGWLRQRADVAAFCSARPADGGTGAVYVLLRHPR